MRKSSFGVWLFTCQPALMSATTASRKGVPWTSWSRSAARRGATIVFEAGTLCARADVAASASAARADRKDINAPWGRRIPPPRSVDVLPIRPRRAGARRHVGSRAECPGLEHDRRATPRRRSRPARPRNAFSARGGGRHQGGLAREQPHAEGGLPHPDGGQAQVGAGPLVLGRDVSEAQGDEVLVLRSAFGRLRRKSRLPRARHRGREGRPGPAYVGGRDLVSAL